MQITNLRHTTLWSLERVCSYKLENTADYESQWVGKVLKKMFLFITCIYFCCLDWSSGSCSSSFRVFHFENNRKWLDLCNATQPVLWSKKLHAFVTHVTKAFFFVVFFVTFTVKVTKMVATSGWQMIVLFCQFLCTHFWENQALFFSLNNLHKIVSSLLKEIFLMSHSFGHIMKALLPGFSGLH